MDKDIKRINENRLIQADSSKIIVAGMSIGIEALYDDGEILAGKSTMIIIDKTQKLLTLLGILNSQLIAFFVNNSYRSLKMAGGYLNISKEIITKIPIANFELDKSFNSSVRKIISMKKNDMNSDTTKLETQINQMVYELYGLTKAEIAIVEGTE